MLGRIVVDRAIFQTFKKRFLYLHHLDTYIVTYFNMLEQLALSHFTRTTDRYTSTVGHCLNSSVNKFLKISVDSSHQMTSISINFSNILLPSSEPDCSSKCTAFQVI